MAVIPYSRGRPPPDRRTDILYRIASKKVDSPKKLIPLFQEKLAAELGTTRRTIDAVCRQYEGMDLGEVLEERFSGIKLFKSPTAWMLDDDKGELLSHVFEGEFRGLCTDSDCGAWTWIPRPLPPFITCDGCGKIYVEEANSHGEVNLSSCQSLYETHTRLPRIYKADPERRSKICTIQTRTLPLICGHAKRRRVLPRFPLQILKRT